MRFLKDSFRTWCEAYEKLPEVLHYMANAETLLLICKSQAPNSRETNILTVSKHRIALQMALSSRKTSQGETEQEVLKQRIDAKNAFLRIDTIRNYRQMTMENSLFEGKDILSIIGSFLPTPHHQSELVTLPGKKLAYGFTPINVHNPPTYFFPAIKKTGQNGEQHLFGFIDFGEITNTVGGFSDTVYYLECLLLAVEESSAEFKTASLVVTGMMSSAALKKIRELIERGFIKNISIVYMVKVREKILSFWLSHGVKERVSLKFDSKQRKKDFFTKDWQELKPYFIFDEFILSFEKNLVRTFLSNSENATLVSQNQKDDDALRSFIGERREGFMDFRPHETLSACLSSLSKETYLQIFSFMQNSQDKPSRRYSQEKLLNFIFMNIQPLLLKTIENRNESSDYMHFLQNKEDDFLEALELEFAKKLSLHGNNFSLSIEKAIGVGKNIYQEYSAGNFDSVSHSKNVSLSWGKFFTDIQNHKLYTIGPPAPQVIHRIPFQDIDGVFCERGTSVMEFDDEVEAKRQKGGLGFDASSIQYYGLYHNVSFEQETSDLNIFFASKHTRHFPLAAIYPFDKKIKDALEKEVSNKKNLDRRYGIAIYQYFTSIVFIAAISKNIDADSLCKIILTQIIIVNKQYLALFNRWKIFFSDIMELPLDSSTKTYRKHPNSPADLPEIEYFLNILNNPQKNLSPGSYIPVPNSFAATQNMSEVERICKSFLHAKIFQNQTLCLQDFYDFLNIPTTINHQGFDRENILKNQPHSVQAFFLKDIQGSRKLFRILEPHLDPDRSCTLIYVVTLDKSVYVHYESHPDQRGQRPTHSELAHGLPVLAAGEMKFQYGNLGDKRGWFLSEINNGSGHYRPDSYATLPVAREAIFALLQELPLREKFPLCDKNFLASHGLPQLRHCLQPGLPGIS